MCLIKRKRKNRQGNRSGWKGRGPDLKKFRFPLDTVLDYKQQALDSLRAEHGAILAQLRRQEEVLERVQRRYSDVNDEFRAKKSTGLTVANAMGYESGLRVLDQDIKREATRLEEIKAAEAAKRQEVVVARQETAAIEKLKEKKLDAYHKEFQKSEEAFIDELVSATRAVNLAAQLS